MTCIYRRKLIPEVPPAAARALDDEFRAIEDAIACGRDAYAEAGAPGTTNLSLGARTTTAVTVVSDTGTDVTIPEATASLAGVATAAQITLLGTAVQPARSIATASGLQGGGDLSANRTLSPVYGNTANTVCQGNDARLSNPFTVYSGGVIRGVLSDASTTNVTVASTDSSGVWQSGRGAIELSSNRTRIVGTSVLIDSLATSSQKAVLANADGTLTTGTISSGSGANFRGRWVSGTSYAVDDMILDGPWLAIATAATTERPAPTETASKIWVIPVSEPTWTGTNGNKLFGTRYGPAYDNNLLCGVRVKTNGAGTISYCYIKMQGGTRIDLMENLAATGSWQEFLFPPIPIPSSEYFDVVVYADSWISAANYYNPLTAVKSFVDTYPTSTFNENGYGVDVLLQNDYASPDWALLSRSVV
jgi:hypothetical protein